MITNTIQTQFQLNKNNTVELKPVYDTKCAYCGKEFNRTYNSVKYCCDDCRRKALQDQKAKYQRKRRKWIREGYLISNETKYVGTNFLSEHRRLDEVVEYNMIQKEMMRLHLR